MSSNINVIRICEHCRSEFNARTTVTRFCSDLCAKRNYKLRQREKKIVKSDEETLAKKQGIVKIQKDVSKLDYLNPTDTARLLMCSVRNVYKLIDSGKIPYSQFSEKKRLISRKDIDKYLSSLQRDYSKIEKLQSSDKAFNINNSLTMGEAQALYNISEKGLYDLIKRNGIRKYKSGKYVLVEKTELDKVLVR